MVGIAFLTLAAAVSGMPVAIGKDASQSQRHVAEGLSGRERFAASELRTYAGGLDVDFTALSLEHGRNVLPKRVVEALDNAKSREAFVLAAVERPGGKARVYVAGKTGQAVLYGVYALLEDYLGFRFFHAGKGGTVAPKRMDAKIPRDLFDFREPCVGYRRISHWKGSVQPFAKIEDYDAWLVRRAYQTGKEVDGLSMMKQGVPLSLFEAHPEYFPEIEGGRSLEVAKKFDRRCCASPEVQRLTAAKAVEAMRGGCSLFLNVRNETGHWCGCSACRRMGQGTNGVFSVTDYVHRFHAAVAKIVLEQLPDADIAVHAYRDFRFPPQQPDLVYDPRVLVIYTPIPRCYAHPLTAPCNERFKGDVLAWRRHARRLGIFGWSSSSRGRYTPIALTFARDFGWLVENGFDGWLDNNTAGAGALAQAVGDWRLFYLASKMFWNPSLDAEKELSEADRLYYGVAYGPMSRFRERLLARWAAAPGHAAAGASERHVDALLPGDDDEMLGWLAEAEKLADGDDELLARIGYDRLGFERFWVEGGKARRNALAAQPTMAFARVAAFDGVFPSEVDWQAAPAQSLTSGGKAPAEKTLVRLMQDGENWHVRFDQEFSGEAVATIRAQDGDLWTEDAVEVFVQAPGHGWRQVIVSPRDVVYDSDGPCGLGWSFGGDVRNIRSPGRLVTDLRLPVARLRDDGKGIGGEWRFRFSRDNARKGGGGDSGWRRVSVP